MDERIEEGRAFLKAHPEVEAALIANFRATLRVRYADLIADMGLSEDEAERFIAVLIKGRTRIVGQHIFRVTDQMLAPGEYTRMLKEVLGEERYALFRAHDQKTTARALADDLVRTVYFTPDPLAPLQIERFKALIQQAIDDPALGPRYTSVWQNMPLPVFDRIVEQAGNTLTPPQIAALANLRHQIVFNRAQSQALTDYHKK
jgi:hypothetical protein